MIPAALLNRFRHSRIKFKDQGTNNFVMFASLRSSLNSETLTSHSQKRPILDRAKAEVKTLNPKALAK